MPDDVTTAEDPIGVGARKVCAPWRAAPRFVRWPGPTACHAAGPGAPSHKVTSAILAAVALDTGGGASVGTKSSRNARLETTLA
jgi:hypothetical protein